MRADQDDEAIHAVATDLFNTRRSSSMGTDAGGSVVIRSSSAIPRPFRDDALYRVLTRRFEILHWRIPNNRRSSGDGVIWDCNRTMD